MHALVWSEGFILVRYEGYLHSYLNSPRKCSKITNTKKIIIFSAVRNFRNYGYEKMPMFEILECRLYQEKNGIYACQNVVEMCSKHGDMILCYLL